MERVTFTRGVKIVAAVFGVLMIGLLAINNLQIGAQLKVVEQQRDFQAQADPLVRDGRILADGLRDRLPTTKRRASDAAALVRAARPLIADAQPLVGELREALPDVRTASRRAPGFMERALELLETTTRIQRETLAIQQESRDLQRRSVAIQRETLAIQKEALVHIRSIDRKTGGTAPVAAR